MREIASFKFLLLPIASVFAIGGCAASTQMSRVGPQAAVALQVTSEKEYSSSLVRDLTVEASKNWSIWQNLFLRRELTPPSEIEVKFQAVGGLAGRTTATQIQLNPNLTEGALYSVFRHELAHAFLNQHVIRNCPGVEIAEIYSEAFALWASQDENRVLAGATSFAYSSQARDFLRDRLKTENLFHGFDAAQALSRVIAEARRQVPSGPKSLDGFFQSSMLNCDFSTDVALQAVLGESRRVELSTETVLIIEGTSGEVLKRQGQVRDKKYPVASILKPILVSEFSSLNQQQTSKDTLPWACPEKVAGKVWTWSQAVAFSCNGFFLDSEKPDAIAVKAFASRLRRFGFSSPEEPTMFQMIGLHPGIEASAESILSLYGLFSERAPHVVSALQQTPEIGTLSRLPDSKWFSRNGIALKSGTLRNAIGEPEHGWIVALGPMSLDVRRPSFLAIIHQQGSSPQLLLSRMRAHLQSTLVFQAPIAKVQILGLVPRVSITAKCSNLLILDGDDKGGFSELKLSGLKDGTKLGCDRGPLTLSYPRPGGFTERKYWGQIEISSPPALAASAPSARQARARRGSEIQLTTSQRSYIAGVLASEYPNGRTETLKALAMIVRFNLLHANVARHDARPICDTTHCQVFGTRNGDTGVGPGERYSKIAQEVLRLNLEGDIGDSWLMYSIGGELPWAEELAASFIQRELGLEQTPYSISRIADEDAIEVRMGSNGQGLHRKVECEKFRNALRLPSCPKKAEVSTENSWLFSGTGAGHGTGLDLTAADRLAAAGRTSTEILRIYFPKLKIR